MKKRSEPNLGGALTKIHVFKAKQNEKINLYTEKKAYLHVWERSEILFNCPLAPIS